jgi:hypothetical protein
MDNKFYALEAADGRVAIMTLNLHEGDDVNIKLTRCVNQFGAHPKLFVPVKVTEIAASDIPTDRSFREAWCFKNGKIDHDMDKAREIHKERIRKLRKIVFKQLDTDSLIATENGDSAKVSAIVAKKQSARDATDDPAIAKAKTVEELSKVDPLKDLVNEYREKIHPSFIEEAKHV